MAKRKPPADGFRKRLDSLSDAIPEDPRLPSLQETLGEGSSGHDVGFAGYGGILDQNRLESRGQRRTRQPSAWRGNDCRMGSGQVLTKNRNFADELI